MTVKVEQVDRDASKTWDADRRARRRGYISSGLVRAEMHAIGRRSSSTVDALMRASIETSDADASRLYRELAEALGAQS